ncbi:MAG: hypothetical protein WD512_12390, partial [Candidatus Paceibacterota bacterium]
DHHQQDIHNINLKMTEIPRLIREKVKDYLHAIYLSEWRSKMNIICDEYRKKISFFYLSSSLIIEGFAYNYREYYHKQDGYTWSDMYIYNNKRGLVCKLSPNY